MAYFFNFFTALMSQTAAIKLAYQTHLSLHKHLAPDDLCHDVTPPLSPAAQEDA